MRLWWPYSTAQYYFACKKLKSMMILGWEPWTPITWVPGAAGTDRLIVMITGLYNTFLWHYACKFIINENIPAGDKTLSWSKKQPSFFIGVKMKFALLLLILFNTTPLLANE